MLINKRIKIIREHFCHDSNIEFAEALGYSPQYASNLTSDGKSVGKAVFDKLSSAFPTLNANWLLTGEGSMLKNQEAKRLTDIEFMHVTLVPVSAAAGYPNGYGDEEYIESLPTIPVIVDKHYKGKYRVFEVDGDSMDDGTRNAIQDKDKILCREVQKHLWQYKLHLRDWFFVIVHREEGVVVKQITEHDVNTGEIKCHSLNPFFKDFTLNLNDVVELYNVIKIVDRNTRI